MTGAWTHISYTTTINITQQPASASTLTILGWRLGILVVLRRRVRPHATRLAPQDLLMTANVRTCSAAACGTRSRAPGEEPPVRGLPLPANKGGLAPHMPPATRHPGYFSRTASG